MVLKAGNCGVCQDPMITSKRRRRPVSPVPSQVNAELAQARPCYLHSRYLMDLRKRRRMLPLSSDPPLRAWRQNPPSLDRTVFVSHNGYCGASWRDEPPSSVVFGLGFRGTNFDREGEHGGGPSPLLALGHLDPIFGLARIQRCAAAASRGAKLRRRDPCPHIFRFM